MNPRILALGLGWLCLLGGDLRGDTTAERLDKYAASLKEKFPEVQTITTGELASLDPAPILLDVREEKEFAVSHLPGALRAQNDPVAQLRNLGVDNDALVVVYCSVGYRSTLLAEIFQQSGFTTEYSKTG